MTRVLGLVSFRVYPTHMGGQKGVALFYEHLKEFNEVVLAGSADNVPTKNIDMRRMLFPNKTIYRNLSKLKALRQLALEKKADVVIAEHSYTGWIAWLLRNQTGIPFIIHSHNIESQRFRKMKKWWWQAYHRYEKWIHRKADHNFFISREDMNAAIKGFNLQPSKCSVITYGIEPMQFHNKKELRERLGLEIEKKILLFNGTLDYEPNYEAVIAIIDELLPLLRKQLSNFQVIITGNRAPRELAEKMLATPQLQYAGYVQDVNWYYQAADVFINPVANDSGVKTKLIEAIANQCTTVSTAAGAAGIVTDLCGDKLRIVATNGWQDFADGILHALEMERSATPAAFYAYYNWKEVAGRASAIIEDVLSKQKK